MSEQLNLFDSYQYEDSHHLIITGMNELTRQGFSEVLPLATGQAGHSAYRAIFEGKGCTVQIDPDGHIMFKHDDSRFYDYGGSV